MSEKYAPEVGDFKKTSQWKTTFRRLCRNRGAVIGMVILFIILMMALFADLLFDYETMVEANNIPERLLAPCWAHPFGTDQFGRDMLARVVHGSRISLAVSASSVTFSLVVGGILGAISGYFGGWVDNIIMRVMDVVMAYPNDYVCNCYRCGSRYKHSKPDSRTRYCFRPTFCSCCTQRRTYRARYRVY